MEFSTEADMDLAKQDYLTKLGVKRHLTVDSDDEEDENGNPKKIKPNYDPKDEFKTYTLNLPANAFPHLFPTVDVEPIGDGQKGAILVYPDPEQGTPIVRSTIRFTQPAQYFQPLHHQLANEIRTVAELPLPLNNCLVQVFDNTCAEVEFESMQAQDLAFCEESYIALFSCYKNPAAASRKLVVESKTGGTQVEFPLAPNSVVVWSLVANSHFRHKVVLDTAANNGTPPPDNEWMGFTFRTSSTCIQYGKMEGDTQTRYVTFEADQCPIGNTLVVHTIDFYLCSFHYKRAYFINGMPLVLLEGDRACSTTHRLRELENERTSFVYPSCMMSTISPGDLLPPVEKKIAQPPAEQPQ